MTTYEELVKKMTATKSEMDFLESAHKQHVFKFLSDADLELSRVKMHLIWDSSSQDLASGVYQVQVLDGQPVFAYEVDAYCPLKFESFKSHFEATIRPYVQKKRQVMQLEAQLKPKAVSRGRLKI